MPNKRDEQNFDHHKIFSRLYLHIYLHSLTFSRSSLMTHLLFRTRHTKRLNLTSPPGHTSHIRAVIPQKLVRGVRVGAFLFLILAALAIPLGSRAIVQAQTLESEVTRLLASGCAALNDPGSTQGELANICAASNNTSSSISTGGAAGASAQTLAVTVENRRKERLERETDETGPTTSNIILGERLGLFASFNAEALNRNVTPFADGFDANVYGLTAGVDYLWNPLFLTGLAFNWINTDGDFDGGGDFVHNSYGGTIFAAFQPTPNLFAQIAAGYARKLYLVSRAASFIGGNGTVISSGLANSTTYGNIATVNALLGYDHPIILGQNRTITMLTIGPRIGLNYSNTHIQDFTETGNTGLELRYDDQYVNSVQSVLGVVGILNIHTGWPLIPVLRPQVTGEYIHEFANSQRFIHVRFAKDSPTNPTPFQFQNDRPVRNFFNIGVGTLAVLPNGIQAFVNFQTMVGNAQFTNYGGSVGLRIAL
ncbi:MAG: autotransporter outer membrane beta-barrel domain-containing protein [Nitrospirae bacterium]|nr:MAG: autotransporter outer membrane beta-barrel domain-containing protein [Nitrospirota bacterium]